MIEKTIGMVFLKRLCYNVVSMAVILSCLSLVNQLPNPSGYKVAALGIFVSLLIRVQNSGNCRLDIRFPMITSFIILRILV